MEKDKKLGFARNIWLMGVVSFLNDLSSEIVFPLVPIFLVSVLGAPATILGLIEGLADAAANILMALSGFVSDKYQRRKPFIIAGYGLSTLSKLILASAFSWPTVLFARVINRLGKGARTTARDALIIESVDKSERGRAFGLHRMMDTFGAIAGPSLSIALLAALNFNYRLVFFWAFIPSAAAMVLLFFLKEHNKVAERRLAMRFQWQKTNMSYRLFLLVSFVFTIGSSSSAFLVLRAQNLGLSVGATISAYILLNTTNALLSLPAGILADRLGAKRVIFLGYILFAYIYMMLGLTNQASLIWILFPAYGVYLALTEGVSKAYISRLVPHEISASAFGVYQIATGLATFIASFVAGILWNTFSPQAPFIFGSILGITSSVLFFVLSRKIRIHPESLATTPHHSLNGK